jgi:hypothetical protein
MGVSALWLQPAAPGGEGPSREQAAARPGSGASGPLVLKLDADSAGFAARAASASRKRR